MEKVVRFLPCDCDAFGKKRRFQWRSFDTWRSSPPLSRSAPPRRRGIGACSFLGSSGQPDPDRHRAGRRVGMGCRRRLGEFGLVAVWKASTLKRYHRILANLAH